MTAHASNIAEYWRVPLGNNFTLGSGITHRQTQSGSIRFKKFQICLSFELAGRNV